MKDKRKNLLICIIIALTLILGISLVIFFCNKKDNQMPPVITPLISADEKIESTGKIDSTAEVLQIKV